MSSLLKKGAVALVTGGASGLGKVTVERLASKGMTVYALDKTVSNVKSKDSIKYLTADVTSETEISAVYDEIRSHENRLDVMVNCAGIYLVYPTYDFKKDEPWPMQDFIRTFEVNVFGTFNVIRQGVGIMAKNQPGRDGQRGLIINVSSCARQDASSHTEAYSASKAAVAALSTPLARGFAKHGIRVVAIAPGPFETPMLLNTHHEDFAKGFPDVNIFPKRMGKPEEFANLVEFIADNIMVNAATIPLDAGFRNPYSL